MRHRLSPPTTNHYSPFLPSSFRHPQVTNAYSIDGSGDTVADANGAAYSDSDSSALPSVTSPWKHLVEPYRVSTLTAVVRA